eukprot:gnl/TRDRNA2_/TRDRNA2_91733_c0_seq1.p1 gnl/TRDRNA2_/TRDRNA2_91733_c0~~gnl/TRDRNA2_/TRDRNA2_91733_c0_seq1.p1  ORF type:complete len:700 (+),score=77.32 gnl/TRDRNA2_/TRDRNA2_91733_c0_seq1:315-2102(+)
MGGQMLLQDTKVPKEICLIDAVAAPVFREAPALPDINKQAANENEDIDETLCSEETADETSRLHRSGSRTVQLSAQQSTTASRARRHMCTASVPTDHVSEDSTPTWSVGHRVRVRPEQPGRAPKPAVVLRVVKEEGRQVQYEIVYDNESTSTVGEAQLIGTPAKPKALLNMHRNTTASGGSKQSPGQSRPRSLAQGGLLSRTAEPDQQRLQVLTLVNTVTSDLAAVMQSHAARGARDRQHISLEDAVVRVQGNGQSRVSSDTEARIAERLTVAHRSLEVTTVPFDPIRDPTDVLLSSLHTVASSSARLLAEDRAVAQRIVAAGLEMLLCGGSLVSAHVVDQLGAFAGVREANSVRRLRQEDTAELACWHETLSSPLQDLLRTWLNQGLLESVQTDGLESLSLVHEAQPCLIVLRRLFDTGTGHEDALRRAVDRLQRLRPAFSFCNPTASPVGNAIAGSAFAVVRSTRASSKASALSAGEDGSRPSTPSGSSPARCCSLSKSSPDMVSQSQFFLDLSQGHVALSDGSTASGCFSSSAASSSRESTPGSSNASSQPHYRSPSLAARMPSLTAIPQHPQSHASSAARATGSLVLRRPT